MLFKLAIHIFDVIVLFLNDRKYYCLISRPLNLMRLKHTEACRNPTAFSIHLSHLRAKPILTSPALYQSRATADAPIIASHMKEIRLQKKKGKKIFSTASPANFRITDRSNGLVPDVTCARHSRRVASHVSTALGKSFKRFHCKYIFFVKIKNK